MANSFFNNIQSLFEGALAKATEVESKFDSVTSGFDGVEAVTDKALILDNADNTIRSISEDSTQRISKILGFDSAGLLTLLSQGSFQGDWATFTYYTENESVRDSADALGNGVDALYIASLTHTSSADLASDSASWTLLFPGEAYLPLTGGDISGNTKIITPLDITREFGVINDNGGIELQMKFGGVAYLNQTDSSGILEKNWITFHRDGDVELDYNGVKKFETVVDGVSITGVTYTSSINSTGDIVLDSGGVDSPYIRFAGPVGDDEIKFNVGSDKKFSVVTQADGDLFANAPFEIDLTTGITNFVKTPTADQQPLLDPDLTRKDYVDNKFSAGVSGVFASPTSITVVDGLITAIS